MLVDVDNSNVSETDLIVLSVSTRGVDGQENISVYFRSARLCGVARAELLAEVV
jgi:hypothetical protein